MHKEILTEQQTKLLPLIGKFSKDFGLVGGRAKWKDYVDMYFIFKNFHSIMEVAEKAIKIFSVEFNEKIFRSQLAYFEDIDYTEKVIYRKEFEVDDDVIKKSLIDFSLNF